MTVDYFDIQKKWGVIVCHDLRRLDEYEIRQSLISFGMRGEKLDEAIDVLLFHKNTGLCISRGDIRMSMVFIGNATSEDQYWDTVTHELYHVACAICDYYSVAYDTEDFAWTMGYLMRNAVWLLGYPCV